MLITFETLNGEIEEYIDPTIEEIINYYGELVDESVYEDDKDFIEYIKDLHQYEFYY